MNYEDSPSSINQNYIPNPHRYSISSIRRVGVSGLKINAISIGCWQNFSDLDARTAVRDLYLTAFDRGIFTFDFGNNYGRPPGSAESMFGSFITNELKPFRNELVISTKAGYDMWPGANGVGSSLKYLISSLDDSLKRLRLPYVDIFYSHRYDPNTPLEETAEALDIARRSGKCLYLGISSYPLKAAKILKRELELKGSRLLINQSHYNMLTRWPEDELLDVCRQDGIGFAAFSPLAQGLLSNKYIMPQVINARGLNQNSSVYCSDMKMLKNALLKLDPIAKKRGQTIAQMAISWVLRKCEVTTAIIGVRTSEQIKENSEFNCNFDDSEESEILNICKNIDVDLWKVSSAAPVS